MLDWPEITLRLGVATLAGCLIGLNRDLQGKPIGLKTLGLVALAVEERLARSHRLREAQAVSASGADGRTGKARAS